jgi:putative endonuclease
VPGVDAFVYLLRCADGSLYCGWTNDLAKRVEAHGRGTASRYTTRRRPVELAAAWRAADRSSAMSLEARIKRLPRPEKLALVAGAPLDGAERMPQNAVASANG